jgi:hypothetical protein
MRNRGGSGKVAHLVTKLCRKFGDRVKVPEPPYTNRTFSIFPVSIWYAYNYSKFQPLVHGILQGSIRFTSTAVLFFRSLVVVKHATTGRSIDSVLRYYSTAKGNRIQSVHMFIFDALENLGVYQLKVVLLQQNDVQ